MKVFGVLNDTGSKDYVIECLGERYLCRRRGQKFELHGRVGTMKELKRYVAEEASQAEPEPEETVVLDISREWKTDPAALLAMLYEGMTVDRDAIMDTLDSWGYVTPEGEIDTVSARSTYKALHEDKIYDN